MKKLFALGLVVIVNCKSAGDVKIESQAKKVSEQVSKRPSFANDKSREQVLLGQKLFFDKRLSKDGTQACVNCHYPEKAYTSGNAVDPKVGGAMNKRNAPSMMNLSKHTQFYWDGRGASLEATSLAAWKNQLGADPVAVSELLAKDEKLVVSFQVAFKSAPSGETISKALAAFFIELRSEMAPWDKAQAGDTKAMTDDAKAGERLFLSSGCGTCHTPDMFTDLQFHNAGIGADLGRGDITKDPSDNGKFKTPSLRNVAITGPYFHDGSVATLEAAIALMAKGGNENPNRDQLLVKTNWSAADIAKVKAFLESLSSPPNLGAPIE